MLIRFHPSAPTIVRVAAVLIIVGSVLDSIMTIASRAPDAKTMLELWRAWVSPVVQLCLGIVFAGAIGRLVAWVYWVALLLWVPFVVIFTVVAVAVGVRHSNLGAPWSLSSVAGYVAMACYLVASVLLPMKATRRAFENVIQT